MYYIVESSKSFYEATFDLKPVIQRLGFEIQNTHDLSEILRRKGIEIDDDCQVFEVCNYRYMEKLLNLDMRLGLMMPWRISVFTENGATKIGLPRPEAMRAALDQTADVAREVARIMAEVEEKVKGVLGLKKSEQPVDVEVAEE